MAPAPPGAVVDLAGVELRWWDLHLRVAHRAGAGAGASRPVVAVRVVGTDGSEGFGECAALAAPTYSEEYAAGAWDVLRHHLVPRLLAPGPPAAGQPTGSASGPPSGEPAGTPAAPWLAAARAVQQLLAPVRGHAMAKAALELAVVDAVLRRQGLSLAEALGVTATTVEAGAVVGFHDDEASLLAEVEELAAAGYRRVKVKIGPGWDRRPLAALREAFPTLGLQADANGAYRRADRGLLQRLDDLQLLCLEQPLAPDDLLGHAELAATLRTPVCLDESLTSVAAVAGALQLGACSVVCVKPARLGGLAPTLDALAWCRTAGAGAWCGGMFESGLARAANATVAALPEMTLPGDLGGGDHFAEGDPCGALPVDRGRARLWRQPGVGPAPSPAAGAVSGQVTWVTGG